MAFQDNLLVRLHKWAVRQDENFLTETFAFLLEFLADNEPEAACELVARITGGIITLSPQQVRSLEIRTQITGADGIPDIELRTAQHFVIIEVKSEAEATEDQLGRYRRTLNSSEVASTGLILLTRYPASVVGADYYFRWYQIAELIYQESGKYRFKAESQFLVEQFLGFLNARNMTMGQVTWEMTTGVRSLRNLVDMLYEAAAGCQLKAQIKGSSDWMGIYIDGRKYWAGVLFSAPETLVFGTDWASVDPAAATVLGIGTTNEWADGKGHDWRREVDLQSEDVHFFARSKASQMQFLEQFLRENLALAEKIILKEAGSQLTASEQEADDER